MIEEGEGGLAQNNSVYRQWCFGVMLHGHSCVAMGACSSNVSPDTVEREALKTLFKSVGGAVPLPGWKRQRFWCSERELFLWDGVTCDGDTGRVTELKLSDNNL